jgi:ABC-type dipeptide/oligopeptide/nickel transport system ATPase component
MNINKKESSGRYKRRDGHLLNQTELSTCNCKQTVYPREFSGGMYIIKNVKSRDVLAIV